LVQPIRVGPNGDNSSVSVSAVLDFDRKDVTWHKFPIENPVSETDENRPAGLRLSTVSKPFFTHFAYFLPGVRRTKIPHVTLDYNYKNNMGDFGAPNALKIYPYTTGSNNLSFDDDDSEEEFVEALASHFHLCESASNRDDGTIIRRKCRVRYTRLDMATFMQQYINDPLFVVTIRMERLTFKLLASLLERDLKVDTDMASLRGGQISIEMCVYLTLRRLPGSNFITILRNNVSGYFDKATKHLGSS
jgi:hypothetical protein